MADDDLADEETWNDSEEAGNGQRDFEERGWERHAPRPVAPAPRARHPEALPHDPYDPRPAERAPRETRARDWRETENGEADPRSAVGRDRFGGQPAPLRAHRPESRDPFFDPPEAPAPAVGGVRRVGPLLGPLEEYEPEDFVPDAPSPARPVTERRAPAASAPRARRPETWGDEDESYAPPEPNRPGPPEQYLPPHLRSEPRMAGTPQPPAPVLTREDISRLQSALFELAECRRLIAGLGGPAPASETDA